MQRKTYKEHYLAYFERSDVDALIDESIDLVADSERIFFVGNGGSNSISSHMMEDFGKMLKKQTFSFSDASLITCYANDYGYENAFAEWIKIYKPSKSDLLVAISSSGNSKSILNAVAVCNNNYCPVLTLSGFSKDNALRKMGRVNLHIESNSYGIVETLHQLFIHTLLDECNERN
jgi:D-sedoheptulose 7-phosphate isomerase